MIVARVRFVRCEVMLWMFVESMSFARRFEHRGAENHRGTQREVRRLRGDGER